MQPNEQQSRRYLATLYLGALGVVYGDIGTSPLYAFRECFAPEHHLLPTPANILGVLSLIFWSLVLIISVEYLIFVMRADNRGEGGIIALMALVRPKGTPSTRRAVLLTLGLFGAALIYGDGMITPAISVLSAIEGLELVTPVFSEYVVWITIAIIIGLFSLQKHGTAKVGTVFGPIMILWFSTMAVLGVMQIVKEPAVLQAILPTHAISFFLRNNLAGFLVLGSVFLVITGGEALYADMGHFGLKPIRRVWFAVVFPALLLNYFGQGAFLLHSPEAVKNPFFLMAPKAILIPLVILATSATVIASQAVISGAFSLTRQAVQLGYLPRIRIRHTSAREIGQIYIPSVNWMLMFAAIGLVLAFQRSGELAAAYGVAVTATMAITTTHIAVFAFDRWKWPFIGAVAFATFFLCFDLSFFGANIVKVWDGGWFPLVIGLLIFTAMSTWRLGRMILSGRLAEQGMTVEDFLRELANNRIPRVPGTAIFMSRSPEGVPTTLLHNIKHNKIVHKTVVLLTVETEDRPHLEKKERYEWAELGHGVYRLTIHFGFMEDPDIPSALERVGTQHVSFNPMATSYFLGRETLIPTKHPGMAIWREYLFAWMMRNSSSASQFFSLPPNQVIELGAQVEL
ncbi:MAG TPA: potassium transporter Kup [Thermoanaerobaculia bacterium]|jgi:KUP system potassium uptake protein|nr:potassium transporter Kup [Thermoanaerobaculia bacterium]